MALGTWQGRLVTEVDADSPLTAYLVGGMSNDLLFLRDILYGNPAGGYFTPQIGHRHNGIDSHELSGIESSSWADFVTGTANSRNGVIRSNAGSTTSATNVKMQEYTVFKNGVLNVLITANKTLGGGFQGVVQIYVNDIPVGVEHFISTQSPSTETHEEDITVEADDQVQLYGRVSPGSTLTVQAFDI